MMLTIFSFYLVLTSGVWCETVHAIAEESPTATSLVGAGRRADEESYGAITFQYTPIGWDRDELDVGVIGLNLDALLAAVESTQGRQLLVFPEYALTTIKVKDDRDLALNLSQTVPAAGGTPCNETINSDSDLMATSRLSCMAKRLSIVLVANLVEKVACADQGSEINQTAACSADAFLLYNTNVAFDTDGTLLAKYRKFNLVEEPAFNKTEAAETVIFTTAFNVTFGLVTGHDLLFYSPAFELVAELGVTNFVHPTAWLNTMPFLTGTQMQMGWAHTSRVNLVSSCYLEVEKGLSGAGVYRKDGSFRTAIGLETGSTIVDERSAPRNPDLANFHTEEDSLMAEFSSFALQNANGKTEASICHNDFCCELQFETTADIGDRFFQLVAFNGTDAAGFKVQACGMVACATPLVASCAFGVNQTDYAAHVTFDYLKLSGVFRSQMVIPSTLKADTVLPFSLKSLFSKEQRENGFEVTIEMSEPVKVHTFALYSHDYRVDCNNAGGAAIVKAAALLHLALITSLMIIV